MFKTASIFTISNSIPVSAALNELLGSLAYAPALASQEKSVGFIPPRGTEHGALVESVASQLILKLMIETRTVPADAVRRKAQEQLDQIETTTGRKPGKKEKREILEDARLTLLPMAFSKFSTVLVWIDRAAGLMILDTTSQARINEAMTHMVKAVDGLAVQRLCTVASPASSMAAWLTTQDDPYHFSVDRECELKAADEPRAVVKYGRHPLDIDEVRQHIDQGKIPVRLALTWSDRVSFVLTDGGQIKKIAFLESVFKGRAQDEKVDAFDADVAIATGELSALIVDLIEALGGKVEDSAE